MSNGNVIRYRNYHQNRNFDGLLTSTTLTQYIGDRKKIKRHKDYIYLVCEAYLTGKKPHDGFNASVPYYKDIQHVRNMLGNSRAINNASACTAMTTKLLVHGKWVFIDCHKEYQNGIVLCEKPRDVTRLSGMPKEALHQSEYCPSKKQLYFNSHCYRMLFTDGLSSDCQKEFQAMATEETEARKLNFAHVMLTKWNRRLTVKVGYWQSGKSQSICLSVLQSEELGFLYDVLQWRYTKNCSLTTPDHWLCTTRPVSFNKRLVTVQ